MDIVQFEVQEYIFPLSTEPFYDVAADAVEKLHADFIIGYAISQRIDELFDIFHRMEVKRCNQTFICHNVLLSFSANLSNPDLANDILDAPQAAFRKILV